MPVWEVASYLSPSHKTYSSCNRKKGSALCTPFRIFRSDPLMSVAEQDLLSLASPALISTQPWHAVEGMLRGLVNNQRKMAQAFVSPFILLITLSLTSYILLPYHFLCSCPLQCYSQFWLKQYLLNKRIILSASARGREAAFKN